jgi:Spy/CpxP family protein refolding chaperone
MVLPCPTLGWERQASKTEYLHLKREILMTKNRIAESVTVAAGLVFLFAVPGLARAQNAQPFAAHAPNRALPRPRSQSNSTPSSDFDGLTYTDEQKAEIDKIHQETESRKAVVAKDGQLSADQKDAMILGYTRLEYGQIFRVLSPEQQKQVRQKLTAQRDAEQAEKRKQAVPK